MGPAAPAAGKGERDSQAEDGRLITTTSIWFSAWSKVRHTQLSTWRAKWKQQVQTGSRANYSITDVAYYMQALSESEVYGSIDIFLLLLDRTKFFDRFCRSILWPLLAKMGCRGKIVHARKAW